MSMQCSKCDTDYSWINHGGDENAHVTRSEFVRGSPIMVTGAGLRATGSWFFDLCTAVRLPTIIRREKFGKLDGGDGLFAPECWTCLSGKGGTET